MKKFLMMVLAFMMIMVMTGCEGQSEEVAETVEAPTFENSSEIRFQAVQDILSNSGQFIDYDEVELSLENIKYTEFDFSKDDQVDGVVYVTDHDQERDFLFFLVNKGSNFELIETEYPVTVEVGISSVEMSGDHDFIVVNRGDDDFSVLKHVDGDILKITDFDDYTSEWTDTDLGVYITEYKTISRAEYSNITREVIEYFIDQNNERYDLLKRIEIHKYDPNESIGSYVVSETTETFMERADLMTQLLSANQVEGLNQCPEIVSEEVLDQALDYYIEHRLEFTEEDRIAYMEPLLQAQQVLKQMQNDYRYVDGKVQVLSDGDEGVFYYDLYQYIDSGAFKNTVSDGYKLNVENYEAYQAEKAFIEERGWDQLATKVFIDVAMMKKFDVVANDNSQITGSYADAFLPVKFTTEEETTKALSDVVYPTLVLDHPQQFNHIPESIWKADIVIPYGVGSQTMDQKSQGAQVEGALKTFSEVYTGKLEEAVTYFNENFDQFSEAEQTAFAVEILRSLGVLSQHYTFGEAGIGEMIDFSTPPMYGGLPSSDESLNDLYACFDFTTKEFDISSFDEGLKNKYIDLKNDPFYTVAAEMWATDGGIDIPMFSIVLDYDNLGQLEQAIKVCHDHKDSLDENLWVPELPVYIGFESIDQVLSDTSMKYTSVWLNSVDELRQFEGADTWKISLYYPANIVW